VAVVWHFNWIKWRPELVFELPIGIWLILGKELEKWLCLTHCGQGRIGWANTLGENISIFGEPTNQPIYCNYFVIKAKRPIRVFFS